MEASNCPIQPAPPGGLWYQNFYRVRKKTLALATQYYIEDQQGNMIGYSRQKMMKIKEDIRIYSDDDQKCEIFRIKQENIMDMGAKYNVIETGSERVVGKIQRSRMSAFSKDEYRILAPDGMQVGRIFEETGRGLARKYMPLGGLVTEQVNLEWMGQVVGRIDQQFKVIGDIWEVDCRGVPPNFDRRILLAGMLLFAMIERKKN